MATQQGITYDTAQEGPFYRVRPHGVASGFAATSGNIESHRGTGQGQQGLSRDTVPQPLTDEAVKGIIKGPDNAIRHAAEAYTKQHLGKPYKPVDNSSSSLAKQGAIGRTFLLAATDHPEYKKAVYEAYKRHMPEHVGEAQDYDQLLQKAYGHLAHETKRQFESLPINMSFHRNGEGNYQDSKEMMRDVHGHRHLYVFQGGDRHDFLHNVHPESGLNDNEMFRAVHDVYGHALHGTTFGPQGEEKAWAAHSGMFSPLAQAAMTAETRGQNSVVNYTPLNARIKAEVAALDETAYDAKRKGRMDLFEAAKAEKKNLLDNHFQFAPQRAVLLPPEMNSGSYAGGIPAYIRHLIQPEGGETAQLTHFSHEPNLTMTDPTRYGTGIKGAEASRLQEPGAVRDRTYFYAGNPERGEVGLGTHKYKAMVDKLYDMGADPLMLRKLAVEANRTPHTSMVNPGLVDQVQAANDYEKLIKDYGYNGMINRNLSMPTAAVFNPVPVQKYADGNSVKPLTLPDVHKQTIGLAQQLMADNPKMDMQSALGKAGQHLSKKFDWEHDTKPALEKTYGALQPAEYSASAPQRLKNTPEVVQKRIEHTQQFLSQPTEPWQPPPPEKQAFDRAAIKHALGGFPDVEQSKFPRDVPARANIEHVHEVYQDPVNRELIKKQILRGLPLGGETFYASLYPVKLAAMEAGIPEEKFNSWIHSIAPASARNSIMNEMAVGQAIRDLHARGVELTPANMEKLRQEFKEKHGVGLPMMPVHEEGVASVLNNNTDLRQHSLANIPTNYKIPTYGTQKAGDFAHSWVGDVHEAAGETLGSPYHPYFKESGGFKNPEYGAAENHMLDIAKELGIPGGMAQAGRWFGGGELTGLVSPRGDALDLLEKQVAYSLHQQGINPTPKAVRDYTLNMIKTGRGTLLPWFKKSGMPDVRTVKKDGGSVEPTIDEMQAALALRKQHMAAGGQPKNPFDYENPEHVANVVKIAAQHKLLAPITDVHKHLADILSGGHYKHIEDPNIQNAIRQAGHDAYYVAEKSGKQSHILNKADGGDVAIQNIGAEEAPNLPTKDFILPHGQHPGQLPVGGIDMQPAVPGQQLWPTQPPGQQPQQGGQPPQGGPAPQGGPQGASQPSNILQMTPQGRALGAMTPPQPVQQKADGGGVTGSGSLSLNIPMTVGGSGGGGGGTGGNTGNGVTTLSTALSAGSGGSSGSTGSSTALTPASGGCSSSALTPNPTPAPKTALTPAPAPTPSAAAPSPTPAPAPQPNITYSQATPYVPSLPQVGAPSPAPAPYQPPPEAPAPIAPSPVGGLGSLTPQPGPFGCSSTQGLGATGQNGAGPFPTVGLQPTSLQDQYQQYISTHGFAGGNIPSFQCWAGSQSGSKMIFGRCGVLAGGQPGFNNNGIVCSVQQVDPSTMLACIGIAGLYGGANRLSGLLGAQPSNNMALPTHAMPIGGCAAAQQQHDYQMYLDATNKCNANPNPAMLLAKKGGTIKSVGKGITKEKVTISPNLDAMQYELMSVKHFKKAK